MPLRPQDLPNAATTATIEAAIEARHPKVATTEAEAIAVAEAATIEAAVEVGEAEVAVLREAVGDNVARRSAS